MRRFIRAAALSVNGQHNGPVYPEQPPPRTAAPIGPGVGPPHSLEAEQSVLGGILLSDRAMYGLVIEEGLKAEDFYRDRHRLIYESMLALYRENEPIDVLTVSEHMRSAGKLDEAGGKAAIDELTGGVPGLGGIRRYAQIVREHALMRRLLSTTYEIQASVLNNSAPPREIVSLAAAAVAEVARDDRRAASTTARPQDLAEHIWRYMEQEPSEGLPMPAGLSSLRRYMRLRPGQITVVYAWSGMGKSHLVSMLCDTVGSAGFKAQMWTNEDSPEEIGARQIQRMTGVPALSIIERRVKKRDLPRVMGALGKMPYGILPCAGMTAVEIAADIRFERPDLAVVDYLHHIDGLDDVAKMNAAMRALTNMAKATGIHLVLVAQCNHERDKAVCRPPPVPRDIFMGGGIYAMADYVLAVHRREEELSDELHGSLGEAETSDEGHISVQKNTGMATRTGRFPVMFDRVHARFVEPAPASVAADPDAWLR